MGRIHENSAARPAYWNWSQSVVRVVESESTMRWSVTTCAADMGG